MDSKKEKLLKKTFDDYIELMLYDFPVERIGDLIAEDVSGYGTTVDEKILEINRLKKVVTDQREQGAGFEMHVNMMDISRRISPNEDTAIFMDEFEISLVIEGAKNVIPLRLTSVFEFLENNWKLVHIHGSKAVATEGDTWHLDEWKKKNEELQRLVDEKTADLETKNRELEIEAALERVRASAMSMQKPDDLLEVCQTISVQLEVLNVKNIRNVQVAIIDESKKDYANYQYFSAYSKPVFEQTRYETNPAAHAMVMEMKKSANSFFIGSIKDEDLKEFKAWRNKENQFPDPLLDKSPAVFYYFYSIGEGGLGLTTYKEISNESLEIFKRFHKVFTLAYQRFKDIRQALAQAREAQIEAALEKVRATAMAMHKVEDLSAIGKTIFAEFILLGFEDIRNTEIVINNDAKESVTSYHYSDYGHDEIIEIGYKENPIVKKWAQDLRKAEDAFVPVSIQKKELKAWDKYRRELGYKSDPYMADARGVFYYSYSIGLGALSISTWKKIPEEKIKVLERFRNVFKLSYQRYKDIEKAEAQAREARIEAGLERVRAQSMMMQHSEELNKTAQAFHEQLRLLGIDSEFSYLWLPDELKKEHLFWATWQEGDDGSERFKNKRVIYPLDKSEPAIAECYVAWESGLPVHVNPVPANGVEAYFNTWTELLEGVDKFKPEGYPDGLYYVDAYMKYGCFGIMIRKLLTEEEQRVLNRFSMEFERAYTRFLDLKKAEAQAREAQIEAALEKIRSRALAMRNSSEVGDVSNLLFTELEKMDINPSGFSIMIFNKEKDRYELWRAKEVAHQGAYETFSIKAMYDKLDQHVPGFGEELKSFWTKGKPFFVGEFRGEKRVSFIQANREMANYSDDEFEEMKKRFPNPIFWHLVFFKHGWFGVLQNEQLPEEYLLLIRRFAEVFDFAFTRFLDLKKAEEQTHEARIEASLEKVRGVALSLQKSDEMLQVAQVLYEQLLELGFVNIRNALIDIKNGDTDTFTDYDYSHEMSGTITQMSYHDDPTLEGQFKMMATTTNDFFELILEGKELENLKKMRIANGEAPDPRLDKIDLLTYNLYSFGNGAIGISNFGVLTEEEKSVLARFNNVFTFAYKRYNDMVQAENQAREALIELSLERIRAQVTAMQESEELLDIVVTMQAEFNKLGHEAHYFWHMRWLPDKYEKALTNGDGTRIGNVLELPRGFHGLKNMMDWEQSDEPTAVFALEPDVAADYIDKMIKLGRFQEIDHSAPGPDEVHDMGGLTFVMARTTHGEIGYTLPGVVPNPPKDDVAILLRFAGVFDLAYRRFEDLKSAEARTKEALKQATLDRVRGQVASMRKPEDLQQITPLIWNELKTLEVPFFRCGVFIIDEKKKHLQVYLTTPEGKSLAALDLDFDQSDLTKNTVVSWRSKKVYQQHWNKDEFIAWAQEMKKLRQIKKPEIYQGGDNPPESLHLHFIPFAQGMLYVGNEEQLEKDKIDLVKSLAEAFSFAYARYEDFVYLEEAKERVEKALGDLKATQTQLIHAEKMASLGELTAGIAHEIQNPLNFVNNFSEVSTDLIRELKEELQNGDTEEVNAIASDLLKNLEKINHHGNRASNIVKSMLEHSRASSAEKQPADINALADEYLRLAYHGMRAKDKSFNADFKLEADPDLPKINVVPQDIGRVLLNLINNAFFAVNERSKKGEPGYVPTVSVTTQLMANSQQLITIKDNGPGIPDNIKEKIFQPFFTTKPTGQGTGLGLSMSYDIITKGHSGELKVESEEDEGSTFIIQIPIRDK